MTSCPPLLPPESQNCSGRGECISEQLCSCNEGWTGFGDFAFQSPSCDINIAAVKALWALLGFINFIEFLVAVRLFNIRRAQSQNQQRAIAFGIVGLIVVSNICFMILSILKGLETTQRVIGTDVLTTVLFCFASAGFWTMAHLFVYSSLMLIHRQAMVFQQGSNWLTTRTKVLRGTIFLSALLAIVFCFAPLGMLGSSSAQEFFTFGSLHFAGLGVTCVLTGMIMVPTFVYHLMKEISDGRKAINGSVNGGFDAVFKELLHKLKVFRNEIIKHSTIQAIIAVLFGAWPFLQVHGSSYFLPMAWFSGAATGILIMYVTSPVKLKKPPESSLSLRNVNDV